MLGTMIPSISRSLPSHLNLRLVRKAAKSAENKSFNEEIDAACINLGGILKMHSYHSESRAIYKKLQKPRNGNAHVINRLTYFARPSGVTSSENPHTLNQVDNPPIDHRWQRQSSITTPAHIFRKNVRSPDTDFKGGEQFNSTSQLAHCYELVKIHSSADKHLEPTILKQQTEKDTDEQERLRTMATEILRAPKRDEIKDAKAVIEVVSLTSVQQEPLFKQQLFAYIEHSKKDKKWRKVMAIAITILVRAVVQFNEADLKGIWIPRADLSYGVFDSAQLPDADLRMIDLGCVWMRQANLSGAQMTGAQFGDLPFFKEESKAFSCAYSPDGKAFAVGLEDGNINVYATSNWEQFMTLSGHGDTVHCLSYSPDGRETSSTPKKSRKAVKDISHRSITGASASQDVKPTKELLESQDTRQSFEEWGASSDDASVEAPAELNQAQDPPQSPPPETSDDDDGKRRDTVTETSGMIFISPSFRRRR
ncbi:MAG: hypothetical protein J3Q66DRAFT_385819 [Benniella sp.]|nr:MAG: hypothetical protein J3Q66DRAFT_385819 [Benniella sp.]